MKSDKLAYRGSLRALFGVFVVVLIVGFLGDISSRSSRNFEKAEGFIADLHAIARDVPRLPDGSIVRQGPVSTGWLDDIGALPTRLQAMGGSLRGAEDRHSLGLVLRGPWSFTVPLETRDSLILTHLLGVPKAVCEQVGRVIVQHPEQVAYVSAFGDPPIIPALLPPGRFCANNFSNSVIFTLDAATEVRRLSADILNAIKTLPANATEKVAISSGSSAPFQVNKGQDGGPGFMQRDQSGIRVTINNVPLSVCVLAILTGPQVFGMDEFETADGKTVSRRTRPVA